MSPMHQYRQTGEGFDAVYRQYHRLVFWHLRRLVADDETRAELAQEVFLRVVRYRERYDAKYRPTTWLGAIAKGVVRDWLRRQSRRPVETELSIDPVIAPERDAPDIRPLVDRLPDAERQVIEAIYFDRLTRQQAAERFSIVTSTVQRRIHQAITELRRMLERQLNPIFPENASDDHSRHNPQRFGGITCSDEVRDRSRSCVKEQHRTSLL